MKKFFSRSYAASVLCLVAACSVASAGQGDGCSTCGPAAQGAAGCEAGGCLTCQNIWDGYCESKRKCIPPAVYPGKNYVGRHGMSHCCPGGGVGIYGQAGQPCGGQTCCGPTFPKLRLPKFTLPKMPSLFSHSWQNPFFAHSGYGCDDCLDGCDSYAGGSPYVYPRIEVSPLGKSAPSVSPDYSVTSPEADEPAEMAPELAEPPSGDVPEPPAPPTVDIPTPEEPAGDEAPNASAFRWLQHALSFD